MLRLAFWAVFIVLACDKSDGFFAMSRNLHCIPPSCHGTLPNYYNDTTGKSVIPHILRQDMTFEAISKSTTNTDPKQHNRGLKSLRAGLQRVVSFLGKLFYPIKVNAAIVAIQLVLSLKMEGPVLRRLPLHLLLFLLEVSVSRPQVIQSVARELGERMAAEIQSLTGKEQYQVGDITKAIVSRYTGKEEYQFGDLTTTTLAKVKLFFGLNSQPSSLSSLSKLDADVSQKSRQAFMGNPQEESASLESILYKVTGKKEYAFGDVTKAILQRMKSQHS